MKRHLSDSKNLFSQKYFGVLAKPETFFSRFFRDFPKIGNNRYYELNSLH